MDQQNELQEISGIVDTVIFQNEENGYTVLRLTDENGEQITVVGTLPGAAPGESMILSGNWMNHAVHGRQFRAEFAQRMMPHSAHEIYAYLASGSVRGIGPATASLIVDHFGERALEILENEPEQLVRIKGISSQKAQQMSRDFRRQTGVRRLLEFVCSFGLRPILAIQMYKFYGDDALAMLRENPYILSAAHIGGSFAEADHLAMEMGLDSNSHNRIHAAVLFELRHNSGNGHCFIPWEKLAAATAELIGVEQEEACACMEELIAGGQIVYEEIAGCRACYLPELYEAETDAAQRLARLCEGRFDDSMDVERLIETLETRLGMRYAARQKETLRLALANQIVVITGGPGTGKTTCVRAILAVFDQLGINTLLAAPTGRAAKRMTELSGQEAQTVHRLLGAKFAEDGERVVFTKNENDQLDCGALILDECSMVDIQLMDALLRAIPKGTRLVMVGDADQLPSVGPGNVFSAVIRSGVVPTVRLTEIFRQNTGSRIVSSAHMINHGEYPNFSENTGDVFRLRRMQAGSVIETITELCAVRLPEKMQIPSTDIQVLSPTRKGELGTVNLNKRLQEALNPADKRKNEKAFGDVVFREGDRVMQIRNNYDMLWYSADHRLSGTGVYNGDIGQITSIDPDAETLTVNFDGRIASYSYDSLMELEHAWAMTVHKAQGSEYRAVILTLSGGGAPMLMTRSVLYTAVTRAKELLILVGDEAAAYRMIDNARQYKRYSALRIRLCALCGCV